MMIRCKQSAVVSAALLSACLAGGAHAEDSARRVCMADAKRLCPDAVKAISRKRAEACLWTKIELTSPNCHAMIVKVHDQRAAARGRVAGAQ